ncbi:MAG: tRNA lysidine(34) synthetase TilS [Proteobacteria bacterium]|nr:tRNA lysidine(34) synthetase TilS [Pseudomonadota bacterium]
MAVSGGIDSTALLHTLHALSPRWGFKLLIGHVNHGLRGEESEADQAFVLQLGEALGWPVACARVDPAAARRGHPSQSRPTLQEAARDARYAALDGLARAGGATRLMTAHTADDQAETVLLRLFRGTGPDGLAGIPPVSDGGRLVRPLLQVSRSELAAAAEAAGWRWREDPSNRDLRYARNRLRRRWLPGLSGDFNPQLLRAVAQLAEAQSRDAEWIEAQVEAAAETWLMLEGEGVSIRGAGFGDLPEALRRRLLRRAWRQVGGARDVERRHLERMERFLGRGRPGAELQLPGGARLRRTRDGAWLSRPRVPLPPAC